MRNYVILVSFFFLTITQAQIMVPAYQPLQYRRNTLPIITTSIVTFIAGDTAASGGTITSDGGTPVSVRGICWSTSPAPTIALPTKTNDGIGIGTYASTMTGLMVGTTYYVRAYATNGEGTAYGNEVIYTSVYPTCGIVTDIDGNNYSTVVIGTQCWLQSNLNVTHYSDGTPIPQVTDATAWCNLTTGAWCYFNNDPTTAGIYGKLYNWYAVAGIYNAASLTNTALRKRLAPAGWHIPTDTESGILINFIDPTPNAGGTDPAIPLSFIAASALKEAGTSHWNVNPDATNNSGFTLLCTGNRTHYGGFFNSHNGNDGSNTPFGSTQWWDSTEYDSTSAWIHYVYESPAYNKEVSHNWNGKGDGYKVRCVKD